jgi:hypothetical protein
VVPGTPAKQLLWGRTLLFAVFTVIIGKKRRAIYHDFSDSENGARYGLRSALIRLSNTAIVAGLSSSRLLTN